MFLKGSAQVKLFIVLVSKTVALSLSQKGMCRVVGWRHCMHPRVCATKGWKSPGGRGGETLNHGVAHEEPLFCTGFVLLVLTVFTVGFSGGVSGVAQALWMCLFGDSSSAACQAAKAFDLHSVFASSGCYFLFVRLPIYMGFPWERERRGIGKELGKSVFIIQVCTFT